MLISTRPSLRSEDAALARRIVVLEAGLQDARTANGNMRRELEVLRIENRGLRATLDECRSADRRLRPLPEMTAGTSIGPRRPRKGAAA